MRGFVSRGNGRRCGCRSFWSEGGSGFYLGDVILGQGWEYLALDGSVI